MFLLLVQTSFPTKTGLRAFSCSTFSFYLRICLCQTGHHSLSLCLSALFTPLSVSVDLWASFSPLSLTFLAIDCLSSGIKVPPLIFFFSRLLSFWPLVLIQSTCELQISLYALHIPRVLCPWILHGLLLFHVSISPRPLLPSLFQSPFLLHSRTSSLRPPLMVFSVARCVAGSPLCC